MYTYHSGNFLAAENNALSALRQRPICRLACCSRLVILSRNNALSCFLSNQRALLLQELQQLRAELNVLLFCMLQRCLLRVVRAKVHRCCQVITKQQLREVSADDARGLAA
jgi:hypothetical protein